MPIPRIYRKTAEAIASYNWTDIAEGTGVVTLYGTQTKISGSTTYKLVQDALPSTIAAYKGDDTTLTFDLTAFNTPKTVKGTAMFSVGVGGDTGVDNHVSVQIFHVRGATATAISSDLATSSHDFGASSGEYLVLIPIPLTQTNFKEGDILRMVVKFINDAGTDGEIGVDPIGRGSTWITSPYT